MHHSRGGADKYSSKHILKVRDFIRTAGGFAILRQAHKTKAKEGQSNSSNTGEDSQFVSPRTAFRITGVSPSEYTSADAELPLKSQPSRDKAPLLKMIAFHARGRTHATKQNYFKILLLKRVFYIFRSSNVENV